MASELRPVPSSFPGAGTVPIAPPRQRAVAASVAMLAIAAFGGFIAVAATIEGDRGFGLTMGALSLLPLTIAVAVPIGSRAARPFVVRLAARSGTLRFVPSRAMSALFPVLAGLALLPALVALAAELRGVPLGLEGGRRGSVYGVGLLGLVMLGQQAWGMRIPIGLALSETGLRGVRRRGDVNVDWDDLRAAVAVETSRGARLELALATGGSLTIEPRWIGSDPGAVAAVIEHFRRVPQERALLADPAAALRRVHETARTR